MHVFAAGINHHEAPVDVRERFALASDAVPGHLRALVDAAGANEGMLLSTCNRVEFYGVAADPGRAAAEVLRGLGRAVGVGEDETRRHAFVRLGEAAVRHVFRVTASLDSLVLGETQVTGQVKDAWDAAREAGTAKVVLDRCLSMALRAAKRVRTETGIGRGAVSVSSVAVDLARSIFGDLGGRGVLVVGAGEMAEQAAIALRSAGVGEIVVVNRSAERARTLAERVGGRAAPIEQLSGEMARADVVVTSTGARVPILGRKDVRSVMRRRRYEPLFLIDIAVPRDVAADVGDLDQVYLYNIDDLQGIVHDNQRARMAEIEAAERIVDEEVARYVAWVRERAVGPVLAALSRRLTEVAEAEAERAIRRIGRDDPEVTRAVERLARDVVGKILHGPLSELRRAAAVSGPESAALVDAAIRLFDLEVEAGEAAKQALVRAEEAPETP
ncbi:MAG: glutamyl-tRNA reductase [Deltaproteobacteria bacterium]|nr:MAG: glutamyl-tRNA reductase [Deltaproteobacteria bacterium]